MKKYFLFTLLLLVGYTDTFSQLSIFPPPETVITCGKKVDLFKVNNPQPNASYHWSASPGAILSSTVGDSVAISFPSATLPSGDTGWVFVQQINSDGSEGPNAHKGIKILPSPQPYLTTNTRVGCERLFDLEDPREDPKDDEPLFISEGNV